MSDTLELIRTLSKCITVLVVMYLIYLSVHRYTESQLDAALINNPILAIRIWELDKPIACKPAKKVVVQ